MKQEELNEILKLHKTWVDGEEGGEIADLSGAYLISENLRGAYLSGAELIGADLRKAYLSGAITASAMMPIHCKWSYCIIDDMIRIGCKTFSIEEWDAFFASNEEYQTKRRTKEFIQIQAVYNALKAYLETLNTKDK